VTGALIEAGAVATCGVIEFELGWATRSSAEFDQLRADRDAGYEWLATHDEDWRRALDVQTSLWRNGRMRAVGLPDLLIAAVAERERVTVLHYDGDYDLLAEVTGQPMQWVVPRGRFPDHSSEGLVRFSRSRCVSDRPAGPLCK
jgi:predicted nucleic acid-binding protein